MSATMKNRRGIRYGKLVAIRPHPIKAGRQYRWICICDCGKVTIVPGGDLTSSTTRSCGCMAGEKHGMKNTPEYAIWTGIINRCENLTWSGSERHGQIGISVCDRWRKSFMSFYLDMGPRPSKNYQIDRIDNTKDYEPDNCRWTSCKVNNSNRCDSKWWYVDGVRYNSSVDAAKSLGVLKQTIIQWCKGYKARGKLYPPKPGCYCELKYNVNTK